MSQTSEEQGIAFAEQFSAFVNNMNSDPRRVAIAKLMREHRTIQQNMMRFCMSFIENMAQQQPDLRNEASVALAKKIMQTTDSQDRALPFI